MTFTADPRVDAYIDSLPDWQQAICREVRALAHAADREVTETINAGALTAMFKAIIANNRAGGWRKLKRQE
jgi:hypothetical protein